MNRSRTWLLFGLLITTLYGCGSSAAPQQASATPVSPIPTTTPWMPPTALVGTPLPGAQATLTAAPALRKATLIIANSQGQNVNMTVEIADTEPARELGLMFRESMPVNAGMLFDFGGDTNSGFWMQNTILPLSIAFITADGRIISIQDMRPLDITGINAPGPYRYALETNQGFFAVNGIAVGDRVTLPGAQSLVIPGLPACSYNSP